MTNRDYDRSTDRYNDRDQRNRDDERGRFRSDRDFSVYGAREEGRDRGYGERFYNDRGDRSYGSYGPERDTVYRAGDMDDRRGDAMGRGARDDRSNSYERGLGGTGAYNPDRMGGDPAGYGMRQRNQSYADHDYDQYDSGYGVYGNRGMGYGVGPDRSVYSDRDMGNLERDRYGRGAAMRGTGRMDQSQMSQGQHYGRGPRNYQRSDDRIKEDVNEQLTYHHDLDATDIDVQVQGGEVTLTGTVQDRRQKRMAEDAAEMVRGVKDVHNQLRVQQGMDQGGTQGSAMSTTAMSGGDTTGMTTSGTTTSSTPGRRSGANNK